MNERKIARLPWLKELEDEINSKLGEQFKDMGFKISDLKLEYDIITPLSNEVESKRLVLTDQVAATYESTFESTAKNEADARRLVGETISKRLRSKGLW